MEQPIYNIGFFDKFDGLTNDRSRITPDNPGMDIQKVARQLTNHFWHHCYCAKFIAT